MRVLIVDDHPLFRDGLATALAAMPGVEVAGEAGDGEAALAAAAALEPDVVVMDLHLPGRSGVETTRALLERRPDLAVLVLTMLDADDSVFAAMRAGARGYLLKGADRAEIGRALEAVARGELVFSAAIAQRVRAWFVAGRPAGREPLPFPALTDREREVVDLLAAGLTNAEIARRLYVSGKTVRNHVSNVFAKLQVADRAAAVARARDAGFGSTRG